MANKTTSAQQEATVTIPAHPLSAREMCIAAEFFANLGEFYPHQHTRSRLDLPDTPVRREIIEAAENCYASLKGGEPEELSLDGGLIHARDTILFFYYGQRWDWFGKRLERGGSLLPLAREELLTGAYLLELLSHNHYSGMTYATPKEVPDYSLPATAEGRQLAEALIRHSAAEDVDERIKTALAGEHSIDVHILWLLAYLAARCKAYAEASRDGGLGFEIDYTIATEADRAEATVDGLPVVKRPGISPSWLRVWRELVRDGDSAEAMRYRKYYADALIKYAKRGFRDRDDPHNFVELGTNLGRFADEKIGSIEANAIRRGHNDGAVWLPVFVGSYFHAMMEIGYRVRFYDDGTEIQLPYAIRAALGMVIGCKQEALIMGRALILTHRLAMFQSSECYPASQCVLQIFASHLGEAPIELKGEAASNSTYKALAAHWRHPDADALTPLLLAVCDEHTRRNSPRRNLTLCDFLYLGRTPVEILLVFKLREALGLPNPTLDHPLMNTPLGQLPKEVPFALDELFTAVMKRARAEGFDENQALADIAKVLERES